MSVEDQPWIIRWIALPILYVVMWIWIGIAKLIGFFARWKK